MMCQLYYHWATATGQTGICYQHFLLQCQRWVESNPHTLGDATIILPLTYCHCLNWHLLSNILYFSARGGWNQTLKLGMMRLFFFCWTTITGQTGIFFSNILYLNASSSWIQMLILKIISHLFDHWANTTSFFLATFSASMPAVVGFKPSNLEWYVNYSATDLLPLSKLASS